MIKEKLFAEEVRQSKLDGILDKDGFITFFDRYRKGNILYQQAVSRKFGLSKEEVQTLMDILKRIGLVEEQEMIYCQTCSRSFLLTQEINKQIEEVDEVFCPNCDSPIEHPEKIYGDTWIIK